VFVSLANRILKAFQWAFSVGGKLLRVVPGYTFAVVIVNLISQLSILLAFFLPLKVIILLGSSGIPHYFPESWQSLGRDQLVAILSFTAAGFYLLNLLAEKILALMAGIGAKCLLDRSQKITLFPNQDAIVISAYLRYSQSLAGLVFIIVAYGLIGMLYSNLAVVIITYLLLSYFCFSLAYSFGDRWMNMLEENLGTIVSMLSSIGFLIAFAYMVIDFLSGAKTGMTKAIISLLLVRQLMTRLAGIITMLRSLYSERIRINALIFYSRQIFPPEVSHTEKAFWTMLEPSNRAKWITEVLRNIVGIDASIFDCKWRETGIPNVILMEISTHAENGDEMGRYLVKLFHSNQASLAVHEASLLAESRPSGIPALPLLGVTQVGKYHCHLFNWIAEKTIPQEKLRNRRRDAVRHIMSYEPPRAIVERYLRSRLLLWQRLDVKILDRLRLIASGRERLEQLEKLHKVFDKNLARIGALPLCIINPDIKPETLASTTGGQMYVLHWGRWSIEPVGAGWPVKENEMKNLENSLERVRDCRESLAKVSSSDVKLAALMFNFESLYRRQHYMKMIDLVPMVLECSVSDDSAAGVESV
jgi:hypothetical protein